MKKQKLIIKNNKILKVKVSNTMSNDEKKNTI